jgi:hypothetical protein
LLLLMLLVSIGMSVYAVRARRGKNTIADALRSPTAPIEFVETPLKDVIEYLQDAERIDIRIDKDALHAAKVDENVAITSNMRGVSLQSGLRLMLRQVGLTYVVRNKILWITTPEEAAASGGAITVETSPINNWKIAEALKGPTAPIEFVETPLRDVFEYLKDVHHIEIQRDPKVFEGTKPLRDPETPVTLMLRNVSLQSSLRIILRDLDLDYAICNEVILITTPDEARKLNPNPRDLKSPGMVANEKRIAAALKSPQYADLKGLSLEKLAEYLAKRHKISVHITPAATKMVPGLHIEQQPKNGGATLDDDLTAILDTYRLQYEVRDEALLITPKPQAAKYGANKQP